ncbi:DNA-3-methyladenine glycosylase [Nocardioides daphniae]|uniref:DNA-3-methyladenine glycosylase n=1 Tax=Nocardioides daphniae TaxID=402297 RepID=UPI0026807066
MHHVVDLARPAPVVAPELLGCRLTSHSPDGDVTLVLTEVEAYEGASTRPRTRTAGRRRATP